MADLNGKRQLCDMDADEFMMQDFNSEDEEDENLETSESFESEIAHVSQERHNSVCVVYPVILRHAHGFCPLYWLSLNERLLSIYKNSLHALKQALKAFRSAVHGAFDAADNDEPQVKILFKVEGDKVFNSIIQLCLQHVYPVLFHHVKGTHGKSGKRFVDPFIASMYYNLPMDLIRPLSIGKVLVCRVDGAILLKTLAEPSMLCVILRHAQQLVPYYACFPKLAREFIKRSVRMWSRGEEHVRVMAFLGIRNIATLMPSSFLELSAKKLYMDFVKNTKFMSPKAKPVITFMQNSLVEIFSLDVHLTYQHAFVYIRQLAIHLRNAMVRQKKDSYQTVYNWQYIQCLHLWCRIVSEVKSNGVLDPLIYPLVQTVLGAIKLVPAARYYPLKFHCIRSLNMLAEATDTFVPVAPFLLEILESTEFNKKIKLSTAKPTPFTYILKVSKQQLGTKPYLVCQTFQ
ncbi:Nucleolar complex protein 2-like protein [Acropora cervicornis]|uniref:Nucleolar complex protein 2-like protein n=1 Tax=Acropora cervicornis TaxID=6130 RepID=A0AAD9V1J4_ACRCE|nr:Nucleolar complex protein 2-like protein [Acropora cervicornis]